MGGTLKIAEAKTGDITPLDKAVEGKPAIVVRPIISIGGPNQPFSAGGPGSGYKMDHRVVTFGKHASPPGVKIFGEKATPLLFGDVMKEAVESALRVFGASLGDLSLIGEIQVNAKVAIQSVITDFGFNRYSPAMSAAPVNPNKVAFLTFDTNTGQIVAKDKNPPLSSTASRLTVGFTVNTETNKIQLDSESQKAIAELPGFDTTIQKSLLSAIRSLHGEEVVEGTGGKKAIAELPAYDGQADVLPKLSPAEVRTMMEAFEKVAGRPAGGMTVSMGPLSMSTGAMSLRQGLIWMDENGRIVGGQTAMADFSTARGTIYTSGMQAGTALPVVINGNVLVDLGLPGGLTPKQEAAAMALLKATAAAREASLKSHPYAAEMVKGEGMGATLISLEKNLSSIRAREFGLGRYRGYLAVIGDGKGGYEFAPYDASHGTNMVAVVGVDIAPFGSNDVMDYLKGNKNTAFADFQVWNTSMPPAEQKKLEAMLDWLKGRTEKPGDFMFGPPAPVAP